MIATYCARPRRPRSMTLSVVLLFGALVAPAIPAWAAQPGFTEDFTTGISTFFSGAAIAHEPSGGVGGAGDGYITVTRTKPDHLGAASSALEFVGDLTADGVTGFSFWLNDVGADDDLEIHFGVGNSFGNFWQTTAGFSPPEGDWALFTVDFSDPSDWVQVRGSGTFAQALTVTDRILLRHDLAPYEWFPDPVAGDLGIDRVTVLPEPSAVLLLLTGGLAARRGRRA